MSQPFQSIARAVPWLLSGLMLWASGPAQAVLQTWQIKGYFDPTNGGAPLPKSLERAFPSNSTFTVVYAFDDAVPGMSPYDGRTDFVTSSASGGGVTLRTSRFVLTSGSSRNILEQVGAGSRLTLNANEAVSGGPRGPAKRYGQPGLDSLVLTTSLGSPWFVSGHNLPALPDLSLSESTPQLNIGYATATGFLHRIGVVTSIQSSAGAGVLNAR
jgi:hypothetical protein